MIKEAFRCKLWQFLQESSRHCIETCADTKLQWDPALLNLCEHMMTKSAFIMRHCYYAYSWIYHLHPFILLCHGHLSALTIEKSVHRTTTQTGLFFFHGFINGNVATR